MLLTLVMLAVVGFLAAAGYLVYRKSWGPAMTIIGALFAGLLAGASQMFGALKDFVGAF